MRAVPVSRSVPVTRMSGLLFRVRRLLTVPSVDRPRSVSQFRDLLRLTSSQAQPR